MNDAGVSCPGLVLGGTQEHVYVDSLAPAGGDGSLACPLRLLSTALALPAPGAGVLLRNVHLKGQSSGRVYSEPGPFVVPPGYQLTSEYPGSTALASWVVLSANGVCATGIRCAVRIQTSGMISGVTVTPLAGPAAAGVVLDVGNSSAPPRISNSVVTGASASGIVALGYASIVESTSSNNAGHGLECVSTAPASIGLSASGLFGLRNRFTGNQRSGVFLSGNVSLNGTNIEFTQNGEYGGFFDVGSNRVGLSGINASGNRLDGLYAQNADLSVTPISGAGGATINTNGGSGIRVGSGDPLITFNARLKLNALVGSRTIHSISTNDGGGIDVLGPLGFDGGAGSVQSTTFTNNRGFGLRVSPTTAAPIRMQLWQDDFSRNGSIGLVFKRVSSANDELVIIGDTIFGLTDGGSTNQVASLCLDNASGAPWTLAAEANFWSVPCPLPLTDAGFQAPVVSCTQPPSTYREVLYTGPAAPISSVTMCR